MTSIYLPFIQTNKKYNPNFEYSLYATSNLTNYPPENAIDYSTNENIRFSSDSNDQGPIYWSICFNYPVNIIRYTFTEPNYGVNSYNCHQKSWDFYGGLSRNNWIPIDSQRNRVEHNSQNYVGYYLVNNSGPFKCFKLEAIEAVFWSLTLTFRRFDIFANSNFFQNIATKFENLSLFHLATPYTFIAVIYS